MTIDAVPQTPIAPWPQEPFFAPGPLAGNARMWWDKAHEGIPFIDCTGDLMGNTGGGHWADLGANEAVPSEWTAKYPTLAAPQKWVPADAQNPIWQAGTMYGRDGYDLFVQSTLCKQVVAALHANPTPIPDFIVHPPQPVPAPAPAPPFPPTHPGFIAELRALLARWGIHF